MIETSGKTTILVQTYLISNEDEFLCATLSTGTYRYCTTIVSMAVLEIHQLIVKVSVTLGEICICRLSKYITY